MPLIIHQFVLQRVSSASQPPVGAIYIIDKDSTRLGRDSSNDFIINDPTISRQHLVIEKHDDHSITLEDLGSRNGTFVNEERLTPSEKQVIHDGDVIRCGKVITFQYQTITQNLPAAGVRVPPPQGVGSSVETMDAPRVDHWQVFLSYSRVDHPVMDSIAKTLQDAGLSVWADPTTLQPGSAEWEREIKEAIDHSDTVVVILSPEAERSAWITREVAIAEAFEKRIFPILVRGTQEDAIPLGLISYQRIDARIDFTGGVNLLLVALKYYLHLT
jgi:predicted component of type VI protein secretion system